mmetsp:Transcript_38451/g.95954  ORF Transcript_38451/g.95954 Transcript_38451/m.95954 type:complete len:242 (-) Transcript_38451:733-1458(-)
MLHGSQRYEPMCAGTSKLRAERKASANRATGARTRCHTRHVRGRAPRTHHKHTHPAQAVAGGDTESAEEGTGGHADASRVIGRPDTSEKNRTNPVRTNNVHGCTVLGSMAGSTSQAQLATGQIAGCAGAGRVHCVSHVHNEGTRPLVAPPTSMMRKAVDRGRPSPRVERLHASRCAGCASRLSREIPVRDVRAVVRPSGRPSSGRRSERRLPQSSMQQRKENSSAPSSSRPSESSNSVPSA